MDNRERINELVNRFFLGNLLNLEFNYMNDKLYQITISYDVEDLYSYEYQVSINKHKKEMSFHYHICHCQLERIELEQNKKFEVSLLEILELQF